VVIGALLAAGRRRSAWWLLNGMTALFVFLGAFFYGVVYTVWLKRRSWLNIVIGGLAGSFAVLAGARPSIPAWGPISGRCCWRWCCSCGRRRISGAWPSPTAPTTRPPAYPMLPVVVGDERAAHIVLVEHGRAGRGLAAAGCFGAGLIYLGGALLGGGTDAGS
jgi:protoheme IX farnesyltransferase